MAVEHALTFRGDDEDPTVRAILEGTATETGERFFAALVENLAKALNTYSSWVTEYIEESRKLRALTAAVAMPDTDVDVVEHVTGAC